MSEGYEVVRRLAKHWSRLLQCRRGSTAVEFGLVAALFLGMILVSLQLFIMFAAEQTLETATEMAGRQILTGTVQSQGLTQAQFQNAVCTNIHAFLSCGGIIIDVQNTSAFAGVSTTTPTLTYDNHGNVTNTWQFQPGNPGSIVVLRVLYQWPMFNLFGFNPVTQQNGTRLLMATAVFKTELYIQ